MPHDPSAKTPEAEIMSGYFGVVEPLMGGTKAMRDAGKTLLPMFPKEEKADYERRLSASTLLPAYSETVNNMTGRVFANEVMPDESVSSSIKTLLENVDLQGNNLHVWAEGLFKKGLSHGIAFVLVDNTGDRVYKTKAEEKAAGARPFSKIIKPEQFLGAKCENIAGELKATEFRYCEMVEEDDPENKFKPKQVEQIKVLYIGKWEVYRKKKGSNSQEEWMLHDQGETTLPLIPVIPFYTNQLGFMFAKPRLMELAYLNVKHWQSQSDQDNILHVARVPLLAFIGMDNPASNPTNKSDVTVSTSSAIYVPMPDGDVKYVEHSGKAIEAGAESLKSLVEDMRMAGAKLLEKEKQATKTAAQANEEAAQEMSPLESMAKALQDCLDQMIYIYALMMNEKATGNIMVNGNFEVDFSPEVSLPFLKSMADSGYISEQTLFDEAKRRGVLSESIDWDEEKERIATQGPPPGTMTDPNEPVIDDDERDPSGQ